MDPSENKRSSPTILADTPLPPEDGECKAGPAFASASVKAGIHPADEEAAMQPTTIRTYTDPICGMAVDPDKALTTQRDGCTRYFCSKRCQERFESGGEPQPHLCCGR